MCPKNWVVVVLLVLITHLCFPTDTAADTFGWAVGQTDFQPLSIPSSIQNNPNIDTASHSLKGDVTNQSWEPAFEIAEAQINRPETFLSPDQTTPTSNFFEKNGGCCDGGECFDDYQFQLLDVPKTTHNCDACDPMFQFYLGGILGSAWATLSDPSLGTNPIANESIFTGGGTVGVAMRCDTLWPYFTNKGRLRLEFEGRGRDTIGRTEVLPFVGTLTEKSTDGWSTMANLWRDWLFVDKFGAYIGGGIGVGGYRTQILLPGTLSVDQRVSAFAWQAGTGVLWNITDRATLDFGYRFFMIGNTTATVVNTVPPNGISERTYSASELLVTFRLYEPFRGLLR